MAVRDQNLQVMRTYVVITTIVAAICLVGWIWSAVSMSTARTQMQEAQARAQAAETEFRSADEQLQVVGKMLGTEQLSEAEYEGLLQRQSSNPDVAAMQEKFTQDMALFGPNVPEQERNYSNLVSYLMAELRARNQQVDNAARQQDELIAENRAVLQRETEAAAKERQRADQLAEQLAAERADFNAKLTASQQSVEEMAAKLDNIKKQADAERAKLAGQITALQREAEELRTLNARFAEQRTLLEGEDFQAPQGEVAQVAVDGRTVYIDLGRQDGLRSGIRFSVIDPDQTRMSEAVPKARIEVLDVQQSIARARVLEDTTADPIVEGDLIYSPAWQPGRSVQFALVGKMDINNDGRDDRELVKELIRQSGGEIVEEVLPDGRSQGQMSVDTRWLVIGEQYEESPNAAENAQATAYRQKYADITKRARGLGVSQMNLDKLMNWLRSSSDERSIPFGAAARASDTDEQTRVPSSLAPVSELYNIRPSGPMSGQ